MAAFKDSAVYLSGEVVTKALPFLIIPYLSRKLGPEGMGELSYLLALIAVFQIIVSFSFGSAIMRFYYTKGKHAIGLLLQSSILHSILVSALIYVVLLSFLDVGRAILISSVSLASGLMLTLVTVFQCQKQSKLYVLVQAVSSVSITLLTIMLLEFFSETVDSRLISILLGNLCALLLIAKLLRSRVKFRLLSIRHLCSAWKYMFSLGLPLLFHQLFGVAKIHFERLLVYETYTDSELGVYFSAWQLAFVVQVVLLAINKALTPYLFDYLKQQKLTDSQVVAWGGRLFVPAIIAALPPFFLPSEVYTLILGVGFSSTELYFPPFVLSMMIMIPYYIVGTLMMYHGDNTRLTTFTLMSSLLHVLLVFYIAPISIAHLAWVSVVSNSVLSLSLLGYGYFYYKRV